MEIEKKNNTNVNIYLMYFFASKQRRKRWTFLLFISNYVLGLIVSVATSRGHTRVCLRWWSGGSGVWQWPQFTKRRHHSFTAVKFTPSLSLIFFSKEQKCVIFTAFTTKLRRTSSVFLLLRRVRSKTHLSCVSAPWFAWWQGAPGGQHIRWKIKKKSFL